MARVGFETQGGTLQGQKGFRRIKGINLIFQDCLVQYPYPMLSGVDVLALPDCFAGRQYGGDESRRGQHPGSSIFAPSHGAAHGKIPYLYRGCPAQIYPVQDLAFMLM
jgi:hypothetical protein